MRTHIRWGLLAGLCGSMPAAALALAEAPRSFSLNLVRQAGAESCISSQRLAALVERSIGPVFVRSAEGQFAIEASLSGREGAGFHARVTVNDGSGLVLGVRELDVASASCHALDQALVLVIVLAIDPEFAARGSADELVQARSDLEDLRREQRVRLEAEARVPTRAPLEDEAEAGHQHGPVQPHDARGEPAAVRGLPRGATGPLLCVALVPPRFMPLVASARLWRDDAPAVLALGLRIGAQPTFGRDTYRYRDESGDTPTLFRHSAAAVAVAAEAGLIVHT